LIIKYINALDSINKQVAKKRHDCEAEEGATIRDDSILLWLSLFGGFVAAEAEREVVEIEEGVVGSNEEVVSGKKKADKAIIMPIHPANQNGPYYINNDKQC